MIGWLDVLVVSTILSVIMGTFVAGSAVEDIGFDLRRFGTCTTSWT